MGKRAKPEEIITKLPAVEVRLSQDGTTRQAVLSIGVIQQTCYPWRKEYCDLQVNQAKLIKNMAKENARWKGRRILLYVIYEFTQECLAIRVERKLSLVFVHKHLLHLNMGSLSKMFRK